jgi:hypothetical protein
LSVEDFEKKGAAPARKPWCNISNSDGSWKGSRWEEIRDNLKLKLLM